MKITQKYLIETMKEVREICRIGHKLRSQAKIPVHQPLESITIDINKYPFLKKLNEKR